MPRNRSQERLPAGRTRHATGAAAALIPLLLALAACAGSDSNAGGALRCPEGLEPATEYRLYFGLTDGTGEVISQEAWQNFVDTAVTPRFPDGLTVLDAYGQWQPPGGDLIRQSSRVLVVGAAGGWEGDAWALMGEIREEWNGRYGGVVYHLVQETCAGIM